MYYKFKIKYQYKVQFITQDIFVFHYYRGFTTSSLYNAFDCLLNDTEATAAGLTDISGVLNRSVSRPLLEKTFHMKIQSRTVFLHRESFETILDKTEQMLLKVSDIFIEESKTKTKINFLFINITNHFHILALNTYIYAQVNITVKVHHQCVGILSVLFSLALRVTQILCFPFLNNYSNFKSTSNIIIIFQVVCVVVF